MLVLCLPPNQAGCKVFHGGVYRTKKIFKGQKDFNGVRSGERLLLKMLADFFTKPLQGTKFRTFRDRILNVQKAVGQFQHPDIRKKPYRLLDDEATLMW